MKQREYPCDNEIGNTTGFPLFVEGKRKKSSDRKSKTVDSNSCYL